MRLFIVTALAMASCISAHSVMWGVSVNGEDQGDGRNTYIRSPPNNNPVKDLTSPEIVCNVNGATAAPKFVKAAAGDTLTFEWYHNTRSDDIIAESHHGPIITWIAQYTKGDATGPIWSKIAEDGYDGSEWAVDKLIQNKGKNDFTLPSSLAPGQYIIRQEIIALHESNARYDQDPSRGAQFYPSCVQFEITGSGSTVPDQKFDFNTDYHYTDPGIFFNLYGSFTSYDIPGPDVFTGTGNSDGGSSASSSVAVESTIVASVTPSSTTATAATTSTVTSAGTTATLTTPGGVFEENPDATSTALVVAPSTTLATVISSAPAIPSTSKASQAPATTSSLHKSCPARRRRRGISNRNVKRDDI
ncbi:hypothetical protein G7046_g5614 [Stylonectria norvegica]|nr:hypothetical protein G7046_g5614 [Stylonectria norvegica]